MKEVDRESPMVLFASRLEGGVDERVNIVELNGRVRYGLGGLMRYLRRRPPRARLTIQTDPNVLGIIAFPLSGMQGRGVVSEQDSLVGDCWTYRLAIALTYGRADRTVAFSNALGAELMRLGVPESKVTTIPNSVSNGVEAFAALPCPDTDPSQPMIPRSQSKCAQLFAPENAPLLSTWDRELATVEA